MVAPTVLDGDRRIERLGLETDVVLPHDSASLRIKGEHEAPSGATLVARKCGEDLFERATRDDQLAVGKDWRGHENVDRVSPGKSFGARVEFPTLCTGFSVERIEPATSVAEEDGVLRDQRLADRSLRS